jgi:hypothetical protein
MEDEQFNSLMSALQAIVDSIQRIQPSLSISSYVPCGDCQEDRTIGSPNGRVGYFLPMITNGQLWWQCSNDSLHIRR